MTSSPLHGGAAGDAGKELLRHLLKDKASAAAQATPPCRQLSNDSLRSEEEEGPAVPGSHNSVVREAGRTLDVVFGLWCLDKMLYWYASRSDFNYIILYLHHYLILSKSIQFSPGYKVRIHLLFMYPT